MEAVELVAATEGFFKLVVDPFDEPPIRKDEPKNKHKCFYNKVEKILKGSLDWIPSPSPSVKIQIMGRSLRCKGKTLLGIDNKLLKTKSLLKSPGNVFLITSSKLSRQ